jgi:hypothetical protein
MKTVISALAALVLAGAGCKDSNTRYDNDQPAAPKAVETTNDLDRAQDSVDRNTQSTQNDLDRAEDNVDRKPRTSRAISTAPVTTSTATPRASRMTPSAGEKVEQAAKRTWSGDRERLGQRHEPRGP